MTSTLEAEYVETIVIGGGQAGLAAGYHLRGHGRPFLILDAGERVGDSWRDRWDSLCLFTPAHFSRLPGMPFPTRNWYFPTKDEMGDYLEEYAEHFELPVRSGVSVHRVERAGDRFLVSAGELRLEASNVIVATGAFRIPKVPSFAAQLDPRIVQLHSSEYRNPGQLLAGDALVVGAGNSGAEIAYELADTSHVPARGAEHRSDPRPARLAAKPTRLPRLPVPRASSHQNRHVDRSQADPEAGPRRRAARPAEEEGSGREGNRASSARRRRRGRTATPGGRAGRRSRERPLVHRLSHRLRLDRPAGLRRRRPAAPLPRSRRLGAGSVLPRAAVSVLAELRRAAGSRSGRRLRRGPHRRAERFGDRRRAAGRGCQNP